MWIDTHAHLNDERFADTVGDVVDRALAAGVEKILVIGTDLASSMRAIELAESFESIRAVVGIQPNSLDAIADTDWPRIIELSTHDRVVGLGETGLDHYWKVATPALQEEYFHRHLDLCDELDLPVVIHCREAEADVVRCLAAHREKSGQPLRGVMHSFTGSADTANQCVALGLHISFAGMATFKKNHVLRTVAAGVPGDRILIETDSPYLAPEPLRGKANEPAFVVHTGSCLAKACGMSVDGFAALTTANAKALFRL